VKEREITDFFINKNEKKKKKDREVRKRRENVERLCGRPKVNKPGSGLFFFIDCASSQCLGHLGC
jgi:hypothetical protein